MVTRILVTGGSRGIGRAVVDRLSEDGHQVVNFDLQPPEQMACDEQYLCVDVSDEAALRHALDDALKSGPITRLVNNAGIVRPQSLNRVSTDDLRAVMDVNLAASVVCAQALLPGMMAAGDGRIVNISSRAALGKTERIAYASSKAALHGFTKALALEVGAHGITVNAVGPGPIATELFTKVNPPRSPATERIMQAIPLRRMGLPSEVAHMVASLLDTRAGFVTGQVIYVCGGMTVGLAS
ncbi:SDR family oxidoreductase [Ottowia beijingensis]|uniref:SDR family oxidoreductase n=1 Tax=Ottowia beijingensis TaxID=1207057 RepID=A0A853IMM2_9BURK|nr:SDR family oxidoreductase [Ottowia beijingensis]NZA01883.1 SDR family oxidoreductase [Ottowia beijingensis]